MKGDKKESESKESKPDQTDSDKEKQDETTQEGTDKKDEKQQVVQAPLVNGFCILISRNLSYSHLFDVNFKCSFC